MGLFDKIKNKFKGENNTQSKIKKPMDTNSIPINLEEIISKNAEQIVENNLNTEKKESDFQQKQESIDAIFKENEDYIFNIIIMSNLFNEENKYSDNGIFAKTEKYLKKYFEDKGFDWNLNSQVIQNLIKNSSKFKAINQQQNAFYDYYCINKMNLKFEDHFLDWVKFVIDESYLEKKPLTKQYARILVGFYYFKEFYKKGNKESLYKNLLAMISYVEFRNWINDDTNTCFDKLIHSVIKRFNKMDVQDLDERVLIIQIIKSKNFLRALKEFDFLDYSAKQSKYSNIYNKENEDNQTKIDLNVKNIITEENRANLIENSESKAIKKETENNDSIQNVAYVSNSEIEKNQANDNSEDYYAEKKKQSNITEDYITREGVNSAIKQTDKENDCFENSNLGTKDEKENISLEKNKDNLAKTADKIITNNEEKEVDGKSSFETLNNKANSKIITIEEDDFDKALKKIGGTRSVKEIAEINFLNSIVDNLKEIEKENIVQNDLLVGESYDEEIEELLYF